jgi:hypothetical protein
MDMQNLLDLIVCVCGLEKRKSIPAKRNDTGKRHKYRYDMKHDESQTNQRQLSMFICINTRR